MFLAKTDQILFSYKWLSACVNIHINAKLLTLADDVIDLIVGEVQLVSILCCPASCTVQVTCTCWVKKDCPRDITAIFLTAFILFLPACKICIDKEVCNQSFHNMRINICYQSMNKRIIRMFRIRNGFADHCSLCRKSTTGKFICPVHDLDKILIRIFINIIECLFKSEFLKCVHCAHTISPYFSQCKYAI